MLLCPRINRAKYWVPSLELVAIAAPVTVFITVIAVPIPLAIITATLRAQAHGDVVTGCVRIAIRSDGEDGSATDVDGKSLPPAIKFINNSQA